MEENTIVQQEEFTFRKFFALVKKSGKRILVYAIIAAIVGACLAVIVGVNTIEKKTYSTTIEYTHKGIEKGLAPDGTVLNNNMIKSSNVINAALKKMGYDEAMVAKLAPVVEDAIAVAPYISSAVAEKIAADPTYEYIPTRYTLSLETKSISAIKSNRYPELLNNVNEAYREYFKETYKYDLRVTDGIGASALGTAVDYYNLIDLYKAQINSVRSVLNALPDSYQTITAKLSNEVSILENRITSLENYVLLNNVQKEGVSLTLSANLANRKHECEVKSLAYAEQITELSNTIEKYSQLYDSVIMNGTDGKITIVGGDTSLYNNLVQKKENVIALKADCDSTAKILEQKSAVIASTPCTEEQRAYVNQSFDSLYTRYADTIRSVNDQIAEYTEAYVINNGVKVVNPASATVSIGWVAVAATFVVTVLVGVVVAIIVTSVKTGKAKNQ